MDTKEYRKNIITNYEYYGINIKENEVITLICDNFIFYYYYFNRHFGFCQKTKVNIIHLYQLKCKLS